MNGRYLNFYETPSVECTLTAAKIGDRVKSFGETIIRAFLPVGYPHSVTEDYLEYFSSNDGCSLYIYLTFVVDTKST